MREQDQGKYAGCRLSPPITCRQYCLLCSTEVFPLKVSSLLMLFNVLTEIHGIYTEQSILALIFGMNITKCSAKEGVLRINVGKIAVSIGRWVLDQRL
jgi:hypothetical protein